MEVNMHEAKSQLSKLVERVNSGEEIVISRRGRPVARLIPYESKQSRVDGLVGCMKDRIVLHEGWDAPLSAEEIAAFEKDDLE